MKNKVCFFAKVKNRGVLERFEFYAQDIRILRELGFDVHVATSLTEIRPADLLFVWWWTWAMVPVLAAKLRGTPVLITGVFDPWSFGKRFGFHQRMMKYALRHAHANVFVSEQERREVEETFQVRGASYVPLTVDTARYSPGNISRQRFVLTISYLHSGNADRKCLREIIQAAHAVHQTHPDIRFVIAGEKGSDYPALKHLVDQLGVGSFVEFPGSISQEQKIRWMQECLIYLSPSRYEGFGLAILEAMSCGAPVVSSAVGAVPEVVGDAGLLVDGSAPEAITTALQRCLDNPNLLKELGDRARRRAVTLFPHERRKTDLQRIISKLLA